MNALEIGLTAARGFHLAGSMSAFGIPLFRLVVAPPALAQADAAARCSAEARLLHLFRTSLLAAFVSGVVWLALEAADIGDAATVTDAMAVFWPVLSGTHFGRLLAARLLLLIPAFLLADGRAFGDGSTTGRLPLVACLTAAALVLHAWSGHAAALEGRDGIMLLASEVPHLLAAGAWLGSLVPLLILVRRLDPRHSALAARRFSPVGILCVGILAASALVQTWVLIGSFAGLIGTDYGLVACAKLLLFLLLLVLAAVNRFALMPALDGASGDIARLRITCSIGIEAAAGIAVVFAAAALAQLPPAIHQDAAWLFAWLPDLSVWRGRDLRYKIAMGLLALAAAKLLGVFALMQRPVRWWAAGGAVAMAVVILPFFVKLLLIAAYRSSLIHSHMGIGPT